VEQEYEFLASYFWLELFKIGLLIASIDYFSKPSWFGLSSLFYISLLRKLWFRPGVFGPDICGDCFTNLKFILQLGFTSLLSLVNDWLSSLSLLLDWISRLLLYSVRTVSSWDFASNEFYFLRLKFPKFNLFNISWASFFNFRQIYIDLDFSITCPKILMSFLAMASLILSSCISITFYI